jgi:hypothetical protein
LESKACRSYQGFSGGGGIRDGFRVDIQHAPTSIFIFLFFLFFILKKKKEEEEEKVKEEK